MIRITDTENGKVKGLPAADPRITVFKGIPFAAPPVGENRWKAPKPCENWAGVREAYEFAPISMQDTPGIGEDIYVREWHVDSKIPMDEDCLYLNVWTGADSIEEKRPVLVWIFGGAFQWGYPAEMEFDGERLARRGIVVVTLNYRLNVFGFLTHPDLTRKQPQEPANFGNLDQQAGLLWVIRNIQNFGGNPKNITLGGQSAGGGSVLSQMTCMKNEGLFQKAIIESGVIRSPYVDNPLLVPKKLKEAQKEGVNFLEYLGVKTIEEAKGLDALFIRDQYAEYVKENPRMTPVIDGVFMMEDPMKLFMSGKHLNIPIITGNTTDEFPDSIIAQTDEEFKNRVKEYFGNKADTFLQFKEAWKKTEPDQYATINGLECVIKCMLLQNEKMANHSDCFYYRFNADIPGKDHPGTFHSVDLWFFFETLAKCIRPFRGEHYDLSRMMCNYWAEFIKKGNPNGNDADGLAMPQWQPYTAKNPCEMNFTTRGPKPEIEDESEFNKFLIKKKEQDLKLSTI